MSLLWLFTSLGCSKTVTDPPPPADPTPLAFEGKKVVYMGDSITAGYWAAPSTGDFPTYRWSSLLTAAKNGVEDNRGRAGDVLENVVVSGHGVFDLNYIPPKGTEYKYFFFNLGVNDMNLASNGFTVAGYTTRLQAVIDKALSIGWSVGDIVLMTPFWIRDAGAPRQLQEDYAAAVRSKASQNHTILIDVYEFMKGSATLQSTGMNDDLHPNQVGHQMIYEYLAGEDYTPQ